MSVYSEMMGFARETAALEQVAGRLGWDQETMMPRGAAPQRAEELSALEAVLHARRSDPQMADWLSAMEGEGPSDAVSQANIAHLHRVYDRASKVPADLAKALAKETSLAQGVWAEARAGEDVAKFLPSLSHLIELKREEAAALASGGPLYDALLNDFERGATEADLTQLFADLRPRLVALRAAMLDAPQPHKLEGSFNETQQLALSQKLAETFGYDMAHGRIDKAVHPFSSGSGLDVRITTRTELSDPFNCLYSTIHEVGHACYEQGVSQDYALSPLGGGVSMGVHESQSRFYENQIGRSAGFCAWLYDEMTAVFGDMGLEGPDAFFKAVNRVETGFIRTEADEVHYNLHVLLRYDLERDLISGALDVADLEEAWNTRFEADFGRTVDKPSNGLLQDVHWSVGLFGYFPTYTLGNVYAGCLNAAMVADLGTQEASYAKGDVKAATDWMRRHVQVHGGLYEPRDVIARATGEAPSVAPLLDYLDEKFARVAG